MKVTRSKLNVSILLIILILGTGLGLALGSWQIIVVSFLAAIAAFSLWVALKLRTASSVLNNFVTELRRLRSATESNSSKIESLPTSRLLKSTMAGHEGLIVEQNNNILEQRAMIEGLVEVVRNSSITIDKTKLQLNRTVRRQVEIYGMIELLEGKLTSRMDQFLDDAHRELRKNRGEISTLARRLDAIEWNPRRLDVVDAAADADFDLARYLYYLSHHIPKEVEAQQQLQRIFQPAGLVPLLGGWALTPTGTLDVIASITRHQPEVVVECGSGTSTLWLSMAVRDNCRGHVYALEHDPAFAEMTRAHLEDLGLSAFATVVDAPIVEHDAEGGPLDWYDLKGLAQVRDIGTLVIDGPPQSLGRLRGGALPLLRHRFASHVDIFADDVNRSAEHDQVGKWLDVFPELRAQVSSTPVQAHLTWDSVVD